MPGRGLLQLESAVYDMNFCIFTAEPSLGTCKNQQYFFISCLMEHIVLGAAPTPLFSLKKAKSKSVG